MPLTYLLKKPVKKYKDSDKRQLLNDHRIRHMWWASLQQGKTLINKKNNKFITKEQIIKEHTAIVRKLFALHFHHHLVDSLDQTLPQELKEKSKTIFSIRKIIQKNILKR